MSIFLAISLSGNTEKLNDSVARNIENANRFHLQSDKGWLIDFDGTTKELCNKLEITGQKEGEKSKVGSALVVPFSSYYGRGSMDMWDWLRTRFEK